MSFQCFIECQGYDSGLSKCTSKKDHGSKQQPGSCPAVTRTENLHVSALLIFTDHWKFFKSEVLLILLYLELIHDHLSPVTNLIYTQSHCNPVNSLKL